MKGTISLTDSEAIKAALREALPDVKSSHRTEAMARGLGWKSNAAMRAVLEHGPSAYFFVDGAFERYLSKHGFEVDPQLFQRVLAREIIRRVMTEFPDLTTYGLRLYPPAPQWRRAKHWHMFSRESMLMFDHVDEFINATRYLESREKRATLDRRRTSSDIAEEALRSNEELGVEAPYFGDGMLLVAALHLGFMVKRQGDSARAYLNIARGRRRRAA